VDFSRNEQLRSSETETILSDAKVIPLREDDAGLAGERAEAVRIAAGVHARDAGAERALVERYSRGLRFLLRRWTGDDELAGDLLQETFIIAFQKLREAPLDAPERLAGYLKGIAFNVGRSGRRKEQREPRPTASEILDAIPDDAVSALRQISAAQTQAAVRQLLDSMTVERDRELLRRYYLQEQTKPEICRALGLDSLHFNRVLHRAKARFRQLLESAASGVDLDAT
jgi:RNA polymerase sigma factor (sigma-70 family)